jgi:hypothetical protein
MATPSLTWCPVFLLEVASISSLSLLVVTSIVPPFESWESLTCQSCIFQLIGLHFKYKIVQQNIPYLKKEQTFLKLKLYVSFFIMIIINLFIHFTYDHSLIPSSPPSSTLTNSSCNYPPPFILREGEAPLGYDPVLRHLVLAGLSISSPTEPQPGSSTTWRVSNGRSQRQTQPQLQLSVELHEDQGAHLLQMHSSPRPSHCMLFGWWFRLCGPRLVDSEGLLLVSLTPTTSSILPQLFHKAPRAPPEVLASYFWINWITFLMDECFNWN